MARPSLPKLHSGYMRLPSSDSDITEPATPLVSSPDTYSIDTLVPDVDQTKPCEDLTTRTDSSPSEWAGWASIKACAGRLPQLSPVTLARILLDYLAYCVALALLSALCTSLLMFIGALVLALREPYATHGGAIVGAGATGGALLSVGLTTVAWAYNKFETAYERAYEIYAPQEDLPLCIRRHRKDGKPQLAHRYRSAVIKWCAITAVPVCGIAGPAVGVLILNVYGVADGMLAAVDGAACGGAGLGVIAGIWVVWRSICYVLKRAGIDDD